SSGTLGARRAIRCPSTSSARPWRNSVPRRPAHTSNIPTSTTGGNYARRSPHVEVNSSRFSSEICPIHRWTSTTLLCARLCADPPRSEEHTSELQSRFDLVCRLLLEKKNKK